MQLRGQCMHTSGHNATDLPLSEQLHMHKDMHFCIYFQHYCTAA